MVYQKENWKATRVKVKVLPTPPQPKQVVRLVVAEQIDKVPNAKN